MKEQRTTTAREIREAVLGTYEFPEFGIGRRENGFGTEAHFYSPNDERIKQVEDLQGHICYIIGYTDPIHLPIPMGKHSTLDGYFIVYNEHDGSVGGLFESQIKK